MKSRAFHFSSLLRSGPARSLLTLVLIMGSAVFCKPAEQEADLAFWAVVAFARANGLTKPSSVNQCDIETTCPNQTEGDFTALTSNFSAGSCNIPSVSLCINLSAFGKGAAFCERSDGELSLKKCSAEQNKTAAVGACVFQRGQAVFYGPLYTAVNGAELCKIVYKGRYSAGFPD